MIITWTSELTAEKNKKKWCGAYFINSVIEGPFRIIWAVDPSLQLLVLHSRAVAWKKLRKIKSILLAIIKHEKMYFWYWRFKTELWQKENSNPKTRSSSRSTDRFQIPRPMRANQKLISRSKRSKNPQKNKQYKKKSKKVLKSNSRKKKTNKPQETFKTKIKHLPVIIKEARNKE